MVLKISEAEQPVVVQNSKTLQSLSFRRNDYEKIPDADTFSKKNDDTVKKAAIGAAVVIGLAALADGIFANGKHIKKLFGIAEKDAKPKPKASEKPTEAPKPETNPASENKDYENWLKEQAEAKKAIEESDKRNEAWVEAQRSAKEKEYAEFWEQGMKEYESGLETFTHDGNVFKIAPNGEILSYKNKEGVEQIEKYLNPVTEGDKAYKKIIDSQKELHLIEQFNAASKPAKDDFFAVQMSLQNGELVATAAPTETLLSTFLQEMPKDEIPEEFREELISIVKKQIESLQISKPLKNINDTAGMEELTADMLTKIEKLDEQFLSSEELKAFKEKILKAKAEQEAKARALKIEEGRQVYNELNQKLDGRISVRVENQKSNELQKLAEKYHAEELRTAAALKRKIAQQTEKIKWFDAYLQDPQLRQVLGIAEDAEIMFSRELGFGNPYVRNQQGNILIYERERGLWREWAADTIEKSKKLGDAYVIRDISQTKKADGHIITRRPNRNYGYDYTVRNLETGTETILKDGELYKLGSDGEQIPVKASVREARNAMEDFFTSVKPEAPNSFVYGSPEVMFKDVKSEQMARRIENYVASFDEGTFQRVDKVIEIYNSDGKKETIHIIFEGNSFDIDDKGRLLQKVKVKNDPLVKEYQERLASKTNKSVSYARNSQKQRRTLLA